jgi:hypothetical protein
MNWNGLIEILSWNLPRSIDENKEEPQPEQQVS